jgi:hypothetical protein
MFKKYIYLLNNMKDFEVKENHIAFSRSHRSRNGNFPDYRLEPEPHFLAQLDN